jgi:branched-chain amino acid transport system substrate-binding protein
MGEVERWSGVSARALVRPSGEVEQLDDALGARLLAEQPELVALMRSLLDTEFESARFLWRGRDRGWISVELGCRVGASDELAVVASMRAADELPYSLTPRELDILTLLAAGLTNPQISERLHTSRRTVSTHVERVLAKLVQGNRAGAAGVAIERGLLRLPIPGGAEGLDHLSIGALSTAVAAGGPTAATARGHRHARERRPLLLGLAAPAEGAAGSDRGELLNGSLMAIEEINALGGIGGRAISRMTVDVRLDDPASIRHGFASLVEAEVDAVALGYAYTEQDSFYDPVAAYGCPVLTSMTSESQAQWVSEHPDRLGRLFQVGPTENHYGCRFFGLLSELADSGAWQPANRRVVCVETPVAAGQMLNDSALALAEQLGWIVDEVVAVANRDADWDAVMGTIHTCDPGAVLVAHFVPCELARFQRRFVQEAAPALLHCVYAPSVPEYLSLAGDSAEGVVWSTVTGTYGDQIGSSFQHRYAQRFRHAAGRSLAGIAYDQVNLLAGAWARAENSRSFAQVADQLRHVVHRGVSGVYALDNPRQTAVNYPEETPDPSIGQAHLVFQIQDGQNRIISPAPYCDSRYVAPPWLAAPALA